MDHDLLECLKVNGIFPVCLKIMNTAGTTDINIEISKVVVTFILQQVLRFPAGFAFLCDENLERLSTVSIDCVCKS